MHATLAYLNAAGTRPAGSDSGCALMRVMNSLLANVHGISHAEAARQAKAARHAKAPGRAKLERPAKSRPRSLLGRLGYLDRA